MVEIIVRALDLFMLCHDFIMVLESKGLMVSFEYAQCSSCVAFLVNFSANFSCDLLIVLFANHCS